MVSLPIKTFSSSSPEHEDIDNDEDVDECEEDDYSDD